MDDIVSGDAFTLIRDCETYPEHRDYIRHVALNERDYANASYSDLCQYCEASAADSVLHHGFSAIKEARKMSVFAALDSMSHPQKASYYNENEDEQIFLRPMFHAAYVENLENLPYEEAKAVAENLRHTDLGSEVDKSCMAYRDKVYPFANVFGEEYEKAVFNKLEGCDVFTVAKYYKENVKDRLFLTPVLARAYLADDSLTYQELKLLYDEFEDTELGDVLALRRDSLRNELLPYAEKGVESFLEFEGNLIDTYKSYAYEDAMDYLSAASGNIIVEFMMPSVGDILGSICEDPVSFASSLISGIVDDVKSGAQSVLDWLTGSKSASRAQPQEEQKQESADVTFRRAYRANVSQFVVDSIVSDYSKQLADEVTSARLAFVSGLVGAADSSLALEMPTEPLSVPYNGKCDISELRSIVNSRNKADDDNVGDALAYASYVPVIGDFVSAVESVYSLSKYQGEVDAVKAKLEKFQDKLSDHFSQMLDHYISLRFSPIAEECDSSNSQLQAYVYENL